MTSLALSGITTPIVVNASSDNTNQQKTALSSTGSSVQNSDVSEDTKIVNAEVSSPNDKWNQFMTEAKQLQEQNLPVQEYKTKLQGLLDKYDGAEADVELSVTDPSSPETNSIKPKSVHEKLIKGGVNDFAKSRSALNALRDYYGKEAAMAAGGSAVSAGLPTIITIIFGVALGDAAYQFEQANNDVKTMINLNWKKGGCRVTATDEFPISNLTSLTQTSLSTSEIL